MLGKIVDGLKSIINPKDEALKVPWMDICDTDLAVDWREVPGKLNNERIVNAFKMCGYGPLPDETAWCGVYAGSVLIRAGFKAPGNCAWARNWCGFGETIKEPVYGCIVVSERGEKGGSAHVGFLVSFDNESFRLHGGNQSNTVNRLHVVSKKDIICFKLPKEKL